MDDILKLLDDMKDTFQKDPVKCMKIEFAKALIEASEDIAKLIKRQDLEGVKNRIESLQNEHTEIRSNFVLDQFVAGGIVSDSQNKEGGEFIIPIK